MKRNFFAIFMSLFFGNMFGANANEWKQTQICSEFVLVKQYADRLIISSKVDSDYLLIDSSLSSAKKTILMNSKDNPEFESAIFFDIVDSFYVFTYAKMPQNQVARTLFSKIDNLNWNTAFNDPQYIPTKFSKIGDQIIGYGWYFPMQNCFPFFIVSKDSMKTWGVQKLPGFNNNNYINALQEVNDSTYYYSTAKNEVFISKDTGKTWNYDTAFTNINAIITFQCIQDDLIGISREGVIYKKSINVEKRKNIIINLPTKYTLNNIWKASDNELFISACSNDKKTIIYSSKDGGDNWNQIINANSYSCGFSEYNGTRTFYFSDGSVFTNKVNSSVDKTNEISSASYQNGKLLIGSKINLDIETIKIFNILGQEEESVNNYIVNNNTIEANINSNLTSGPHFVKIYFKDGSEITCKFII